MINNGTLLDKVLFLLYTFSMINKEIWKDIKGYEGYYQVSNFGRIKNVRRGTLKKPQNNGRGYRYVQLKLNGSYHNFYIHRLVPQAFLPNPDNLPEINHKDEDKSNNCVDNLEWCSSKYNANFGNRNNLVRKTLEKNREENKKVVGKKIYKKNFNGFHGSKTIFVLDTETGKWTTYFSKKEIMDTLHVSAEAIRKQLNSTVKNPRVKYRFVDATPVIFPFTDSNADIMASHS